MNEITTGKGLGEDAKLADDAYQAYLESGQTVKRWCGNNNISVKDFYYRLKKAQGGSIASGSTGQGSWK